MNQKRTKFSKTHHDLRDRTFRPIGIVRSAVVEPENRDWDDVISEIHLRKTWLKALKGIEDFSHIIVLFYLSRSRGVAMQTHPRGRKDLPLVGMFSTRSPRRPNPVGLTICRLIKRRGCRLTVKGLDAIHGTPIIDIKPYIPDNDLVKKARVPKWIRKLR